MNELDETTCTICGRDSMSNETATAHYLAHIAQMMAEDRKPKPIPPPDPWITAELLMERERRRDAQMAAQSTPFVSDIALTNPTSDPIYDRNDILLERSAEEARSSTGGMAMRVGPVWMTPWAASYVESKRQSEV
jgi:hypothetical protein